MMLNEANNMQSHGSLFTDSKMTPEWLKSWSPDKVYSDLETHMPYLVSLLRALLEDGKRPGIRTEIHNTTIATVGSIIWNGRSQRANYFAKGFTAYLYSSGAHAATIGVLNRLGISTSYSTLLDSLESLSQSCTRVFQKVAYQCRSFWMWDNVNFDSNVAEQRVKNAGTFESGTAATLVEFEPPDGKGPEAIDEALDLGKYLEAVENAADIKLDDLILTSDDEERLRKEFTYEAIKVLTEYAGSNFKRFKKSNLRSRPFVGTLLRPRVTRFYPLPTFHLEQASANGNATVIEAIIRAIKAFLSPWFKSRLTVITGDLLTVNRILSVRDVRTLYMRTKVHVKDPHESLVYLVPFSGLFHTRMTAATSVLQTHFGKPNARPSDAPASLWRHNELLKRKNIIPTGKIVYRVSQDLILHSLYARTLDIVRLESTHESLKAFGKHLKQLPEIDAWEELRTVVSRAVTRFTTPEEADTDDVLRNSILFIRDAFLFRSFISSIKSGNV
ncbi:Gamma-tubulin complex component 4 [Rhizoctonia solani]|uniref:Gamma-tubulin complex component 4 n=1 Tax=Rhizoctonia solani TaxID=456999 RepID=A0A0K6FTU8_9AGAM|nr:Gamma-tubulin complex component 4 [Rhizoctonia solani]